MTLAIWEEGELAVSSQVSPSTQAQKRPRGFLWAQYCKEIEDELHSSANGAIVREYIEGRSEVEWFISWVRWHMYYCSWASLVALRPDWWWKQFRVRFANTPLCWTHRVLCHSSNVHSLFFITVADSQLPSSSARSAYAAGEEQSSAVWNA